VKPRFLTLLAIAATLGFGAWVLKTPHTLHEVLLACVAWVLGFWVAAGINISARDASTDDEEEWDEEEWDEGEGDEDDEAEWDEDDA
jgi:hypothetical protein